VPTFDDGLILASTRLTSSASLRVATITYACEDTDGVGNPQIIADALQTNFYGTLAGQIDTAVTIGPTEVLLGDGSDTPGAAESAGINSGVGTNSAASPPPNVALLVKKVTQFAGRANRGRLYLPWGISEENINEAGVVESGARAGAQGRFDNWLAALDLAHYPLVIANRVYDLPWDDPERVLVATHIGKNVTALIVDQLVGTQRRRLR
jgi:hypothetical protein